MSEYRNVFGIFAPRGYFQGKILLGMCHWHLRTPTHCSQLLVSDCFVANYRPHLSQFGHYSLFLVYFVANYRPHLSSFFFFTLKVPKKCDPILVTLLKLLEKMTPLKSVESWKCNLIQRHIPSSPLLGGGVQTDFPL